jgi:Flp pilus assembly protein TadG
MRKLYLSRKSKAQSIVETLVGSLFLIPMVLFLFDVAFLVLTNSANDTLAKSAARAAASATVQQNNNGVVSEVGNYDQAFIAARTICTKFQPGNANLVKPAATSVNGTFLRYAEWNSSTGGFKTIGSKPGNASGQTPPGQVTVITTMLVKLPVPFPGPLSNFIEFNAQATEPIVSLAPET